MSPTLAVGYRSHREEPADRIARPVAPWNDGSVRRRRGAGPWLRRAACAVIAAILLLAPLLTGQAVAGQPGQRIERLVAGGPRALVRCQLKGPSRFPESGNAAVRYQAPKEWGCGAVRGLWERAEHVDGDGGRTFRFLEHRWQCVTIARPDHGRHTTFGCFHVDWKVHYDTESIPGKPIVRFFLPVTAD